MYVPLRNDYNKKRTENNLSASFPQQPGCDVSDRLQRFDAVMSVIVFSVFLCISGCFRGSSAGLENITAEPGRNVTLTCKDEKNDSLIVLEWSREDLGTKKVFVFRDGRPFPARQHESYENRVFLKDSEMKDGYLSVVLENVTMNDSGTYQCRVRHKNDPQRGLILISTIHLSVVPPGDKGGKKEDGRREEGGLSPGGIIGIVLSVLLLLLLAAAVGLWIYRKTPKVLLSGSPPVQSDNVFPEENHYVPLSGLSSVDSDTGSSKVPPPDPDVFS